MDVSRWRYVYLLMASDGLFERRAKISPNEEEVYGETATRFSSLLGDFEEFELQQYAKCLVQFAKTQGSSDDISVVLFPISKLS